MDTQYGSGLGWRPNIEYDVTIEYTSNNIKVYVNNQLIFDVGGCFQPGKIGFFNDSQSGVTYSDFSYQYVANIDINDDSLCLGTPLIANASGAHSCTNTSPYPDGTIFSWDFGDGATNTGDSITHNYSATGQYSVALTLSDSSGCVSQADRAVLIDNFPVVDLGNDTVVCEDQQVLLNADNPGASYLWNTGGTTSTIQVSSSDNYSVTVTNTTGCATSDTVNLIISPFPVVDIGQDTTICEGESILLNAGSPGFSYQWSTGENTQEISANTSEEYSVTVSDTNGCSASDLLMLTINPLPIIDLGHDTAICAGESLQLDAGNTTLNFLWNTSETSSLLSVSNQGLYHVIASDSIGCSGTDSLFLTVNPLPSVSISAPANPCYESGFVELSFSPEGGVLLGTGVMNGQFDPKHPLLTPNQGNLIQYTYTDSNQCTSMDSTLITVRMEPTPTLNTLDTTICFDRPITLSAVSNEPATFTWYSATTAASVHVGSQFTASRAGSFVVQATNEWCEAYSDTLYVAQLTPNVAIEASEEWILLGEEITVTATSDKNDQVYNWSTLPSGEDGEGATEQQNTVSPNQSVGYVVQASHERDLTCLVTDTVHIIVAQTPLPDEVFSPGNEDGINDFWRIEYLNTTDYPNNVVKVYTRWGNQVFEGLGYDYDGTDDPSNAHVVWDGMDHGNILPVASYYYVIELHDRDETVLSGSITIMR